MKLSKFRETVEDRGAWCATLYHPWGCRVGHNLVTEQQLLFQYKYKVLIYSCGKLRMFNSQAFELSIHFPNRTYNTVIVSDTSQGSPGETELKNWLMGSWGLACRSEICRASQYAGNSGKSYCCRTEVELLLPERKFNFYSQGFQLFEWRFPKLSSHLLYLKIADANHMGKIPLEQHVD